MKRFERLIKLTTVNEIAKKYKMSRRAASGRIERHHIQGYQVGRLAYYELTEELDRILSIPVKKAPKKEKSPLSKKRYEIVNDLPKDVCITVDGKKR